MPAVDALELKFQDIVVAHLVENVPREEVARGGCILPLAFSGVDVVVCTGGYAPVVVGVFAPCR